MVQDQRDQTAYRGLHAVNAQHRFQRIRRTALNALGIMLLELLHQMWPRNQRVHPHEKLLALDLVLPVIVFHVGKDQLIHQFISEEETMPALSQRSFNSELPKRM